MTSDFPSELFLDALDEGDGVPLGEALDRRIAESVAARPVANGQVLALPTGVIDESPSNPRKRSGDLDELTTSIRARGILVPGLARPIGDRFELVLGARRLRAARAAGLETFPVIVRSMSEGDALCAQVLDHVHHEDLHEIEEADALAALKEQYGFGVDRLAKLLGKSSSQVWGKLQLSRLQGAARETFLSDGINLSIAQLLARLRSEAQQEQALRAILEPGLRGAPMTFVEARDLVARMFPAPDDGEPPALGRLGPKSRFLCEQLRCRLTVKTCVDRQDARRKVAMTGALVPAFRPCGLGTCAQGKEIRERAEAPVQLQVLSRVGQPGGPPRRHAAKDGRFVAEPERVAHAPKVPRAQATADEWLSFVGEHRLTALLREPQRWRATTIETADEPVLETPGQVVAACLVAAAGEAVRARVDRRLFLRLATHFFNALLEQQPTTAPEAA